MEASYKQLYKKLVSDLDTALQECDDLEQFREITSLILRSHRGEGLS